MTPQEAAIRLRGWYQAFKNFGKGNERAVHEFLEAADLIESLAAELDTFQQFTKELGARNEELQKEKLTLSLRVKQLEAERDAAIEDMKHAAIYLCCACKNYHPAVRGVNHHYCEVIGERDDFTGAISCGMFKWRGVQKEE